MKENRTNQLTKEEQQEYTKLRNIKIIGEVMGKELSEEQKQRLEGFETRLSEVLDASNYGIYDTPEIQRNSEAVNSEVEYNIRRMEEEKKNKETELEEINKKRKILRSIGNFGRDAPGRRTRCKELNEEIIELGQKIYKERGGVFPEDGPNRPLELEEWRKLREIMTINNENKQKIINAVNKISSNQFNVSIQKDGSRQIEFKLGEKKYKLLDINVWAHTEDKYKDAFEPPEYWMKKDALRNNGMEGDDVNKWENEKLKEYVKEKQSEGLDIPKIEEVKDMLKALGKEAGISKESDQISMLMYLTGMYSRYKLYRGRYNGEFLSALICDSNPHFSNCAVQRLFMIAHN